jgi:hypothetical protein
MSARKLGVAVVWVILISGASALAQVAVEVELVPDRPGPYYTGESLTIDVWLHSRFELDVVLRDVQFDFSRSDAAIELPQTFEFDLDSIPKGFWTSVFPEMPVPLAQQGAACICPERFLPFPTDAHLHIGSVSVTLPPDDGPVILDASNAAIPASIGVGLWIGWTKFSPFPVTSSIWTAFDGEIVGGAIDLTVVTKPIPAVSTWGVVTLLLGILIVGSIVFRSKLERCAVRGGFQRSRRALFLLLAFFWIGDPTLAEPGGNDAEVESVTPTVDSGYVSATGSGTDPVIVFSQTISSPAAPWMRLHFSAVELSGSPAAGNASFLRLSSAADGDVQLMDADELARWDNSSGYFTGDGTTDGSRERRTV